MAYDVDMFGEPNFIGQYTVPLRCIKKGFRSVQLKNSYSEDLELAGNTRINRTFVILCIFRFFCYIFILKFNLHHYFLALLIHITLGNPYSESSELQELRESAHDLQRRSLLLEAGGDDLRAEELHTEAQRKERDVMRLMTTNR